MQVFSNVLEMVGRTPMLEVNKMDTGPCRLFLKLELMNPGGSIKDRIGISMIEQAEKRGDIKPGDTIVEATAGNTGLGLALVAAQKGYRLILVLPDKMSQEKIFNLRAMGTEVVLTRSDVAKGHPEYYQDLGLRIAEEHRAYFINQFGNPDNPLAHETTTAPEIFEQLDGKVDAIVLGVGIATSGFGLVGEDAGPATSSNRKGGSGSKQDQGGGGSKKSSTTEVAVLNGTAPPGGAGVPGIADRFSQNVRDAGFEVGAVDNAGSFTVSTVMWAGSGEADAAKLAEALSPTLGELTVIEMTPEIEALAGGADVALVVGQDDAAI